MEAQTAEIKRALIVCVDFHTNNFADAHAEFRELVESSGLSIIAAITAHRHSADPRFFVGKGKVDEIKSMASTNNADVIIFNHTLSPAQERNLEKEINVRVIDRIGLILDIFAQRARSYEGKLQVELAQLQHLSTRLIRGWTHLERQKGGIGLRGPGETQLETDRRLIGQRIKMINQRLQKVRKQRLQSRQQRKKNDIPVVSLVGYTNAGKSTLFNYLTGSSVFAANKLFATLDPTLRRIETGTGKSVILTDTVGFIRDLPPDLVESFKATLDEVREADLLVHVIDADLDNRQERIEEVNQIIELIGAQEVPQIEVYNKIDLHENLHSRKAISEQSKCSQVWLSSLTGDGVELLLDAIDDALSCRATSHCLRLPVTAGQLRAKLFDIGAVRSEDIDEQGDWIMKVELEEARLQRLCEEAKLNMSELQSGCAHY